jgi:large subunit ribosomal protein L4
MAEINVINKDGVEIEKIKLDDSTFNGKVNNNIMQFMVRALLNNRRAGTAANKSRAEVHGSNRKIFRQKGTGNARMGRRRTPLRKGGGVTFAKKQRDFSIKVTKKVKRQAIISALTSRFGDFVVLDQLTIEVPKTKEIFNLKKRLGLPLKTLLVVKDSDINLDLSVRNLGSTKWVTQNYINVFDLLYFDKIVFTKDAILELNKRMAV